MDSLWIGREASGIYLFLSHSLDYPQKERIDAQYFSSLYLLLDKLEWRSAQEGLAAKIQGANDYIEELQVEYTGLFINSAGGLPAPPYESYYRSAGKGFNSEIVQRVTGFYQQCGYTPRGTEEPADHIVYELNFLGLLAGLGKESEAVRFLGEHFKVWFPEFRQRVIDCAEHPFYKIMVDLVDFFINSKMNKKGGRE